MTENDPEYERFLRIARIIAERLRMSFEPPKSFALTALSFHRSDPKSKSGSPSDKRIEELVVSAVSERVYYACSPQTDPDDRERAAADLHAYLWRRARRRGSPEEAEQWAQEAIMRIFATLHTVREPRAFLLFAQLKLLSAIRDLRPPPEDSLDRIKEIADDDDDILDAECIEMLRAAIERMPLQFRLVIKCKLEDRPDEECARLHNISSVANVRTLRYRAMEWLRTYGKLEDCL